MPSGWLFELQLRSLRRARFRETGRTAKPLPQFGLVVWGVHPWAALKKVSQIAESRLRSIPVTVTDWEVAPMSVQPLAGVADRPVLLGLR